MDEQTAFVTAWLGRAATELDAACAELTRLDAARGDADHGVNMQRGFAAVVAALAAPEPPDAATALRTASDALRRTVGGTSGPLWSLALRRIGRSFAAADGRGLTATLADGFTSAAAGVAELGDAAEGDGTMLDALLPAAHSLTADAASGTDLDTALRAAAAAARAGAEATAGRVALRGRASYLGERALGSPDPGAMSAAIVVGALAG